MKIYNLILFISGLVLLNNDILCQTDEFLDFSCKRVEFLNLDINSITVKNNDKKYNWTLEIMKGDHYDSYPFSYIDSVDLFFNKIATRYLIKDSVYYAIHFCLEKGIKLGLSADSFLIPKEANVFLYTLGGRIIEKYDGNNLPKFSAGINSYYFPKKFEPRQNIVILVSLPYLKERDLKIHFNALVVVISDLKRRLKVDEEI
jgi:hypothetical protein